VTSPGSGIHHYDRTAVIRRRVNQFMTTLSHLTVSVCTVSAREGSAGEGSAWGRSRERGDAGQEEG